MQNTSPQAGLPRAAGRRMARTHPGGSCTRTRSSAPRQDGAPPVGLHWGSQRRDAAGGHGDMMWGHGSAAGGHRDAAGGRGTGTWHGDMGCPPCAARRPGAETRVVSSSWTWAMPHCRAMPAPLSAVSSPGKSTSHGSTRHCPIRHAPTAFATVPVVQTVYYGTCSTCCVWCSRNLICNQLWGGGAARMGLWE